MERIAKGIKKFVLENPQPYIMPNNTNNVPHMVTEPVPTITSANRNYLCMPYLMHYHAKTSQFETRGQDVSSPLHTIDTNPRHALVAAFLSKYYGGPRGGFASGIDQPVGTITAMDHNALCSAFLCCLRNNMDGKSITEPVPTITSGGCHIGAVKVFLNKYLGTNSNDMPTVNIGGQYYLIYDIGMRMLIPRELYLAQGFPIDYVIDRDISGRPYPKSKQIARCGNAVPPPFAEAITRANLPELCGRKIDTMQEWRSEAAAGI
jgi:DNA (cytosine-5)-methyltransferase 1